MMARWSRSWSLIGTIVVLAGCASASGPPATAVAKDVSAGGSSVLYGARTVWLAGATSRTGPVAAGLDDGAHDGSAREASAGEASPGEADVREELARAVRRTRGIELAPTRDAADLVLYFEQADRLRCFGCRQPDDLWHWWGLVVDRHGRELASLHGETADGPDAAAQQFVRTVKSLARLAER